MRGPPVLVLNTNVKRETGRKAQLNNIKAAKTVADVIRTCLGPKAMLKMILTQHGTPLLTNDGHSILRELNVAHPAAKSMLQLSKTQDEEVGDGTTSVVIVAGEVLSLAEPWLTKEMHPRLIIDGYTKALDDSLKFLDTIARKVDTNSDVEMMQAINSCLGTKFSAQWGDFIGQIALKALRIIETEEGGKKNYDIKRYIKIEKIPGGEVKDSCVIPGSMFNKDVVHSKMRRRIEKPRVILLDCNLEYKKPANTVHKLGSAPDFEKVMREEEEAVKKVVMEIIRLKPDLVITEKGLSDEAQHWFVKHNVSAFRRLQKSANNRLARATGATIVTEPQELKESDVGTKCGLFEIKKIGDEYWSFITDCEDPKTCSILLRGPSKDVLNELERNLHDAMAVARNVLENPFMCPGGGATEMAIAAKLAANAKTMSGVEQYPYHAISIALEVIPRTLLQNCGSNIVRTLTNLRATHATAGNATWGVNGITGELADMKELGIWEPVSVKAQTLKTSIEAACMILRIDDVVSGIGKDKEKGPTMSGGGVPEDVEG